MKFFISTLFLIFFISPLLAEEFRCPDKIETKQALTGEGIQGWQAVDDTVNGQKNMESMHVYDGNPNNVGASLAPDNKGSKNDPYWTRSLKKELWVSCSYHQTSIHLAQPIPKDLKKCTLKFKKSPGYAVKKIADRLVCEH